MVYIVDANRDVFLARPEEVPPGQQTWASVADLEAWCRDVLASIEENRRLAAGVKDRVEARE